MGELIETVRTGESGSQRVTGLPLYEYLVFRTSAFWGGFSPSLIRCAECAERVELSPFRGDGGEVWNRRSAAGAPGAAKRQVLPQNRPTPLSRQVSPVSRAGTHLPIVAPVPAFMGAPPAEPVGEAGLLEVSLAEEIATARQPIGFAVGCGGPAWGLRDP